MGAVIQYAENDKLMQVENGVWLCGVILSQLRMIRGSGEIVIADNIGV